MFAPFVPSAGLNNNNRIEYNVQDCIESFTGRNEVLFKIQTIISENQLSTELTTHRPHIIIISGAYGVGKSEVARRYIQLHKSSYHHIIWINAVAESVIQHNFRKLAKTLNPTFPDVDTQIDSLVKNVHKTLCKHSTLFVFDNAGGPELDWEMFGINRFIPSLLKHDRIRPVIFITSENTENSMWPPVYLKNVIELSGLDVNECFELLKTTLRIPNTEENLKFAAEINGLCNGLPLKLHQVIRFIKHEMEAASAIGKPGYTLEDFISSCRNKQPELMQLFRKHKISPTQLQRIENVNSNYDKNEMVKPVPSNLMISNLNENPDLKEMSHGNLVTEFMPLPGQLKSMGDLDYKSVEFKMIGPVLRSKSHEPLEPLVSNTADFTARDAELNKFEAASPLSDPEKQYNVCDPIVGFDFGTTYSMVSVFRNNSVEVVPNDVGEKATPSYISFQGNEIVVGDVAKRGANRFPPSTVFHMKRMLGRSYDYQQLQSMRNLWPFQVVDHEGDIHVSIGKTLYSPKELITKMLLALKQYVKDYLGQSIAKIVATIPAHFDENQRSLMKKAFADAGLNVLMFVTEPTAAALSYNILNAFDSSKYFLVFDLGGGTFDLALLESRTGLVNILAMEGDPFLGGEDFDNAMMEYCITEFRKQYQVDIYESNNAPRILTRLRQCCETEKKRLTQATNATVYLDFITADLNPEIHFTVTLFNSLISKYLSKCMSIVERVLEKFPEKEISEVILVGGSSRVPKVREMLRERFGGREPKCVNPEEAVVRGAAIMGSILRQAETTNFLIQELGKPVLPNRKLGSFRGSVAGAQGSSAAVQTIPHSKVGKRTLEALKKKMELAKNQGIVTPMFSALKGITHSLYTNTNSSDFFGNILQALDALSPYDRNAARAESLTYDKNMRIFESVCRSGKATEMIIALEQSSNLHILEHICKHVVD